MTRRLKYAFSILAAIVTISGVAYFWMKYMMESDDPFALVNHPLQPAMLHLHVLAAPAFLVAFGIVVNSHVARRIGNPVPNRRSGLLALVTIALMTASGYLLQVVTTESWQRACVIAHLVSGVVFAVSYLTHLAISARLWATGRCADQAAA
jgi:uncharacterized membrane protein